MAYITKKIAKERLQMYLDAEEAILTGQSYKIGSRELKRADLAEVTKGIKFWGGKVDQLESGRTTRNRVTRATPRDL